MTFLLMEKSYVEKTIFITRKLINYERSLSTRSSIQEINAISTSKKKRQPVPYLKVEKTTCFGITKIVKLNKSICKE